jgi:peptidoglycan/xylan/chitin deacetylase (PgdA/CDA1 family)
VYCGGHRGHLIALTFDDGPGVYTRLAIHKLRTARLHATFFLVGKEIRAYPKLAPLERSVGAFGDHTMTHPFLPALGRGAIVQQLTAARSLIERTVQEPVALFRPPYGGRTRAIDAEARRLGMVEVLWNVDSADSLGASYAGIERNVIAGLRPGSIILMHENHGQTIRALPVIFAAIKRRHLHAVTLPQLLTADPPSARQLRRGSAGCAVEVRRGNGG